jgi:glyoxylase-like metal-dependent hydrolase (beta-lactamase superfamily II)
LDSVEIKTVAVAGKVHMLEGRGGNIGVTVGDDGLIMIDDQFAPLAPKIRKTLAELAAGKPRLKFVLNTHWHSDHTGGNPEFGREATIIAHTNVRGRLIQPQEVFGRSVEALPPHGWPVITFDESVSLHFNGEEIKITHVPNAHTDGDSIVHFTESNVLHTGDLFFNGMFPVVDLDHGGDVGNLAKHIGRLVETLPKDIKIIPGHGPLASLDDLKTYQRMLDESVAHVRRQLAAGKDLDEIKAAGMPDPWGSWGAGFIKTDKWLETVASSLVRNNEAGATP